MTNKSEQDRRALLNRNDATTYHQQAMIDLELDGGGRFSKAGVVTGDAPTVQYPRLPSGPWADSVRVPDEPPLGFSVDDLEPSGEAFEVERSIAQLAETEAPVPAASTPTAGVIESLIPKILRRKL